MIARVLPWFEDDDDPRDLWRWAIAGAIVIAIHAAAITAYVYGHQPDQIGDETTPVAVDLAPSDDTVDQAASDRVPDEEQTPQPPPPPPPPPAPAVTLPDETPPPPVVEQKPAPSEEQQARTKGGAERVAPSWLTSLVRRLQQYKRYPNEARDRNEIGTVTVNFTVDRTGHLLSRQIAHSSGHPALDKEGLAMLERAQPFPVFPASMTDAELNLTIPISFDLH